MRRVLVVDDAVLMRGILRVILEKNGFQVIGEAANGYDGIKKYKELSPDLVAMDISMPEMDGIQALKEIKAINPAASIIMVSAIGQEEMIREAIRAGAKGFIAKPFKEDVVAGVFELFSRNIRD